MTPRHNPLSTHVRTGIAAVALAAALAACIGSGRGSDPVAVLAFEPTIEVVAATDAAIPPKAHDEAQELVRTFTGLYQRAFVDPEGWKDPEFPYVLDLFDSGARGRARAELGSLTIGDARDEVRRVTPAASTIKVTVYVDAAGKPSYAVAAVAFSATGALKEAGPPLSIVQKAVFWLRPADGGWRVFAYQARNDQAQNPASPSPSPSPGGSR